MCGDKRSFNSQREAQGVLNLVKHPRRNGKRKYRARKDSVPVRSYQCEVCKLWYLTSRKNKY